MCDAQTQALLDAALRDQQTFRILAGALDAPLETTLFHAQQALEKGLKALLVARGIVFPRTHDLLVLASAADANSVGLEVSRELLARLAPYAVEFRYLGVKAPDVGIVEAGEAVDAVLAKVASDLGGGDMQ